jgi:hypothetical protein
MNDGLLQQEKAQMNDSHRHTRERESWVGRKQRGAGALGFTSVLRPIHRSHPAAAFFPSKIPILQETRDLGGKRDQRDRFCCYIYTYLHDTYLAIVAPFLTCSKQYKIRQLHLLIHALSFSLDPLV